MSRFEIRRGDVVGVIGSNGAGKSTLLKILSRITEPTTGRVEIRGRVASLLEVGTGFHPELTGRENIFLNGAILGMTRAEIRKKFDKIVDFAGVERFLDTPVKRYSSGMYVRLAFAVAAHLEPEILVVDEVLAVGDVEFQKKCIGKMSEVAKGGRTVLFVSHNIPTIRSLCDSGVLLENGMVAIHSDVITTLARYQQGAHRSFETLRHFPPNGSTIYLSTCGIEESSSRTILYLNICSQESTGIAIHCLVRDQFNNPVGIATVGGLGMALVQLRSEENEFHISLNTDRLARGRYFVTFRIDNAEREPVQVLENALTFDNQPPLVNGCSETLNQEWGYGCLHIESSIAPARTVLHHP